jgi:hypothetical protein
MVSVSKQTNQIKSDLFQEFTVCLTKTVDENGQVRFKGFEAAAFIGNVLAATHKINSYNAKCVVV